jgi:hypothetical protein
LREKRAARVRQQGETDDLENVLRTLGSMLLSGGIEVVDCSGTLGPTRRF